jgi:protein SCO1/2
VQSRRAFLIAGSAALAGCGFETPGPFANVGRDIDDVALTSSAGESVRWRDLSGGPRAVFFGFTHCPVICPVTVYELTAAMERTGASALRIHFITVDPERDTPERMREYFSGFGPSVTGFTGEADALRRVWDAFEITATRAALDNGGYTIDHTATVFLLSGAGRVQDVVAYGAEPEVLDQRVRALVSR